MADDHKLVEAVTKLIRLTQDGRLAWKSGEPPYPVMELLHQFDTTVQSGKYNIVGIVEKPKVVHAYYNKQLFRLAYLTGVSAMLTGADSSYPRLDLMESTGKLVYSVIALRPLQDLVKAVEQRSNDVLDNYLDKLLNSPD